MITSDTISTTVDELDRVFHNEMDFQIEFVRQLDQQTGGIIRPEFRYSRPNAESQTDIDLLVLSNDEIVAIELKYPKDSFTANASPADWLDRGNSETNIIEPFELSSIGAYDMAMYPFWKDVETLEGLVFADIVDKGYVLLLTNYSDCWSKWESGLVGDDFLLYEGREVSDTLDWKPEASQSTREEYPSISLRGRYYLSWEPYEYSYPVDGHGSTEFKTLLLQVSP